MKSLNFLNFEIFAIDIIYFSRPVSILLIFSTHKFGKQEKKYPTAARREWSDCSIGFIGLKIVLVLSHVRIWKWFFRKFVLPYSAGDNFWLRETVDDNSGYQQWICEIEFRWPNYMDSDRWIICTQMANYSIKWFYTINVLWFAVFLKKIWNRRKFSHFA